MRRPLPLLLAVALGASVVASVPALADPAPQADPRAAAAVPDQLVVGYVAGATEVDKDRARGRVSAARQERVVEARADRRAVELVRLPQGAARDRAEAELEADPAVAYAEPNWVMTHQALPVTDPHYTAADPSKDLWGLYGDVSSPANQYGSQAAEAWARGNTGTSTVYVGVIDEGIQFDHPDLRGQVWTNPKDLDDGIDNDGNGYVDDVHGWDFANNDETVYDGGTRGSQDDHGTHVSGTIGARADGKGVVGVNHAVTLISGKFLGRRGGSLVAAVKALDYFTDLKASGVNVVATNNSWGGGAFSQSLLEAITRGAKRNILFVAAAGNSGTNNDVTPAYPSGYDTSSPGAGGAAGPAPYDAVIAVAAIDRAGAKGTFSQFGATSVDLGAPGVGVWSTTAFSGYSTYDGTSMATPHVTGAAALYAASHPGSSAAAIKTAILGSAVLTTSLTGKTVTGGRLDASGF